MLRRLLHLVISTALIAAAVAPSASARTDSAGGAGRGLPAVVFGHSQQGRALIARRLGEHAGARKVLVVGIIHGDEAAGGQVIRALRREHADVRGVDLWTVAAINPDGRDAGTRTNARGVDLNRNFSYRWSGPEPRGSGYYAGPHPFSEPESRALRGLIRRVRPDLTIYYHQPWGQVLAPCHGDARLERRYSEISGVAFRRCRGQALPGTATSWQEHRFPGSHAFVVELPGGPPSPAVVRRNAHAVTVLARSGTGAAATATGAARGARAAATREQRSGLASLKPRIHDMLIPYGVRRKHEMAAYSERHYGQREWRLRHVGLIVEHLSVTPDVQSVYNTFATDSPDPEFGELPNVCSHYVVGRSGRIYRLVPLTIRCRHVVGLNYLSVGIEHVGDTETDVLGNPRQLRASLRLTRWLSCRYNLDASGVIGHNESLSSPFYRELDPRFRGQTHGDWRHPYMRRYRRMLRSFGACPA